MTALAASYDAKRKDGQLLRYDLAAGVHVFKGALVCVTTATGLLAPGADAAGVVFAGVAYEEGNNIAGATQYDGTVTSGAAGALSIRVQKTGVYQYHKTGAVQADVGKTAFFLNHQGGRLSARSIDSLMDRVGHEAGVELSAHVLCHTFATNLIRGGQDLVLVAKMTGHARLETVRRYSLPTQQDLEKAVEGLPTDS